MVLVNQMLGEDKGVITFPSGISWKGNVIARPVFELTNYLVAVQYVCYNVKRTAPIKGLYMRFFVSGVKLVVL